MSCWSGDGREVAYTDSITKRGYCSTCAASPVTSSLDVASQYVESSPPEIGDVVECRTVGTIWEGFGEVIAISTKLEHGGTPVAPAYLVLMEDSRLLWFTPVCLKRMVRENLYG